MFGLKALNLRSFLEIWKYNTLGNDTQKCCSLKKSSMLKRLYGQRELVSVDSKKITVIQNSFTVTN